MLRIWAGVKLLTSMLRSQVTWRLLTVLLSTRLMFEPEEIDRWPVVGSMGTVEVTCGPGTIRGRVPAT